MTKHENRQAAASRDVGIRKPLSPGWHAELPGAFHRHDVYREYADGTRMHMGTLTVEAVKAWQQAGKIRLRRVEPRPIVLSED